MQSKEWLVEAESNIKVKKQLKLLSNADIDIVLNKIKSLSTKKEGREKRSNYVSLKGKSSFQDSDQDDTEAIATKPKNTVKSVTKTKKKKTQPTNIDIILRNLSDKDKALLAATLQKEKNQRETEQSKTTTVELPKRVAPQIKSSSGSLAKAVLALIAALPIGLIGGYKGAEMLFSPQNEPVAQEKPEQSDANKKFLRAGEMAPYKIKRYISQSAYDEDSLKFRNWKMHAIFENPNDKNASTWLMVSGEVNGKNRLGAYVGFKKFIAAIDPDTGEVDSGKYYSEDDSRYYQVLQLMNSYKTLDAPIVGP